MGRLSGQVAVVLGASAKGGTGWAVAERFAAEGAKVVVGARTFEPLARLADQIGGLAVKCDAAEESDVAALAAAAVERFGKVDLAVNCAGLPVPGSIDGVTLEMLESAVRVNFFGSTWFVKHMARAIKSNGSIVLISSMSTTHTFLPFFAYACAKSALDCLVRYAAVEYGPRGIRVNSILPGPIDTEMGTALFSVPGTREAFAREIPLRRIGRPEDFADGALMLALQSFTTGVNLQLNGGNFLFRFPFTNELPDGKALEVGVPLGDRKT